MLEKRIATLRSQISITFEVRLDKSGHTEDRQIERNVTRGDINLLLGKAVDEITTKIILGEINGGDVFILFHTVIYGRSVRSKKLFLLF